jgi:uncharacterized protein
MTVQDADSRAGNKAIVNRFLEAWDAGDFVTVGELLDPNAEWWTLAQRQTLPAHFMLKRISAIQTETSGGLNWTVGVMTAEEDRVSVIAETNAEFPDRGSYNNLYHFLFHVRDGRIAKVQIYYDTALANKIMRGEGLDVGPLASHAD